MSCPYRRIDSNTGFKNWIYTVNNMQTSYILSSEVFGQTKCNFKSNSSIEMLIKIFCNQRIWSWRFSDCAVPPTDVLWYKISWSPDQFPQSRLVSMFWSVFLLLLIFYSDDLMLFFPIYWIHLANSTYLCIPLYSPVLFCIPLHNSNLVVVSSTCTGYFRIARYFIQRSHSCSVLIVLLTASFFGKASKASVKWLKYNHFPLISLHIEHQFVNWHMHSSKP